MEAAMCLVDRFVSLCSSHAVDGSRRTSTQHGVPGARLITAVLIAILASSVIGHPAFAADDASSDSKGRAVSEFLTPDGRFDLEAARASGYEGPIDIGGFQSMQDPTTRELRFTPGGASLASDPDDIYWRDGFGYPGLNGQVRALSVYNGELIVSGQFSVAGGVSANNIAAWDGSAWSALGAGIGGFAVNALAVFNSQLIVGGEFT
jgi:hypothetical protein